MNKIASLSQKLINIKFNEETVLTFVAIAVLSFGLLYSEFNHYSLLVFGIAVFVSALCIFKKPETGIYAIFILAATFEKLFTLTPLTIGENTYKIYPLDFVLIITFLAVFLNRRGRIFRPFLVQTKTDKQSKAVPNNKKTHKLASLDKALVIFLVIISALSVFSFLAGNNAEIIASAVKNLVFYASLYFLVPLAINSPARIKRFGKVIITSGILITIFIAIGFLRGEGLWTEYTPLSTEGSRLLAGTHAFYAIFPILLIATLLATSRLKKKFKNLALILVGILTLGVIFSLMRHLWIASLAALATLIVILPQPKVINLLKKIAKPILAVAVAALLAVSIFFAIPFFQNPADSYNVTSVENRVSSFSSSTEDASASYRLRVWQSALENIRAHPIIGIGIGKQLTYDLYSYITTIEARDLHNSYLSIAVSTGLLGLLALFGVIVAFFATILKAKNLPRKISYMRYFVPAAFICFLVAAFFDVYLELNVRIIAFFILMGLGRALLNESNKQNNEQLQPLTTK